MNISGILHTRVEIFDDLSVFLLILFYIVTVPVHISDLICTDRIPAFHRPGKMVISLLIIPFTGTAVVPDVSETLVRCINIVS